MCPVLPYEGPAELIMQTSKKGIAVPLGNMLFTKTPSHVLEGRISVVVFWYYFCTLGYFPVLPIAITRKGIDACMTWVVFWFPLASDKVVLDQIVGLTPPTSLKYTDGLSF